MFRSMHRYLAFTVGAVLLLQCLSGSLLILDKPIDRWLNGHLYGDGGNPAGLLGYDAAYRRLQSAYPQDRVIFLRDPSAYDGVYEAVLNDFSGQRVYLDAASGELIGKRSALSVPREWLLVLHIGTSGGETLEHLMGYIALIAILILASGLVLWSYGWRRAGAGFRWSPVSTRRLLADTHRDIGLVTLPVLLFLILTGAAMIFHETTEALVTAISGQAGRPAIPGPPADSYAELPLPLDLDETIARARVAASNADPSFISLPSRARGLISVRLRHPDEWHSNGRNTVIMEPVSGDILLAYDTRKTNATQSLLDNMYPLHVGNFGGVALQSVYFLSGIAVVYFFVSGVWLWWQQGRRRR